MLGSLIDRRRVLVGGSGLLGAACLSSYATPVWAKAGNPAFLTAGMDHQNNCFLVGLDRQANIVFQLPIPSRGHAAAAHPFRAEAVAFARRPGRFALVINCATGQEIAHLQSPEGRHFYGHGAFTADGNFLFTTENAYDEPAGKIGIWDVEQGYKRIDEVESGGIGPHEIIRLPDGSFAIANGGIQTHPDFERAKLNLPTMQTSLVYMDEAGNITEKIEAAQEMRQNSIRHIAADANGNIVAGLQWQGNPLAKIPLLARHQRGEPSLDYSDHPETARLKQYAGSVALSPDDTQILLTGPKGGYVLVFDGQTGAANGAQPLPEAAGAAKIDAGIAISYLGGLAMASDSGIDTLSSHTKLRWDNHLVAIG